MMPGGYTLGLTGGKEKLPYPLPRRKIIFKNNFP
jgi:hypothetical protein